MQNETRIATAQKEGIATRAARGVLLGLGVMLVGAYFLLAVLPGRIQRPLIPPSDLAEGGSWDFAGYYCMDGTPIGECSHLQPYYCNGFGQLVPDCHRCGCPSGTSCGDDGLCHGGGFCEDGTRIGHCSANQPYFCNFDETLVADCEQCGCGGTDICLQSGYCWHSGGIGYSGGCGSPVFMKINCAEQWYARMTCQQNYMDPLCCVWGGHNYYPDNDCRNLFW